MLWEDGLKTMLGEFPRTERASEKAALVYGGLESDEPNSIEFRPLKAHLVPAIVPKAIDQGITYGLVRLARHQIKELMRHCSQSEGPHH